MTSSRVGTSAGCPTRATREPSSCGSPRTVAEPLRNAVGRSKRSSSARSASSATAITTRSARPWRSCPSRRRTTATEGRVAITIDAMPQEATGKAGVPSDARQKPERPRDELGRPLPWDQPTRIHLPDFDAMTLDGCHQAGRGFLAAREFFGAHEAWETAWKKAKGTGEEELFKGLSQMGAGYVHLLRGNAHG